jgi:hypothetical protein
MTPAMIGLAAAAVAFFTRVMVMRPRTQARDVSAA